MPKIKIYNSFLLINNPQVKFTKLVYRRKKGFGRVNEILAQPIVSLFKNYRLSFLSSIPYLLSGEVAFRGDFILEKNLFSVMVLKFISFYKQFWIKISNLLILLFLMLDLWIINTNLYLIYVQWGLEF